MPWKLLARPCGAPYSHKASPDSSRHYDASLRCAVILGYLVKSIKAGRRWAKG
ncbi:hypothetical protein L209DRAFT_564030 [Thermothelomyces heterothallicus CBS 203.75]